MNGQGKDLVSVLAWAHEHLTLTPDQEEFLAAWFDERPDPRELRPTPIPEEELRPYLDVIATHVREVAHRRGIPLHLVGQTDEVHFELDETTRHRARAGGKPSGPDDGRPHWLDPELWDRLEEARLDAQRSRVWGRRWYGDDARPTGPADL